MMPLHVLIREARRSAGLTLRDAAALFASEGGIGEMALRLSRLEAGEPDADPTFALGVALWLGIVPDSSCLPPCIDGDNGLDDPHVTPPRPASEESAAVTDIELVYIDPFWLPEGVGVFIAPSVVLPPPRGGGT